MARSSVSLLKKSSRRLPSSSVESHSFKIEDYIKPRSGGQALQGVLGREFYERSTLKVAQDCLGKLLVVRSRPEYSFSDPRSATTVARIVETEGYHGNDPAAHCARGVTPRSEPLFGKPGIAYVYFIYGMYEMLNFVTEREGYPGAVLIRAVEPVWGFEWMRSRRVSRSGKPIEERNWSNGPGRLTVAMGIERSHNRQLLSGPSLYVLDDGWECRKVMSSPRVGISQATDQMWRYYVEESSFVSRVKENEKAVPLRP